MHRRTWTLALLGSACALAVPLVAGTASAHVTAAAGQGDSTPAVTLTVAPPGSAYHAQYSSVQAAIDAVPDNSATPYVIRIEPGVYSEYPTVPSDKLHLTIEGATANPDDVVITGDHYNQETDPATGGTYGTLGSATMTVDAPGFTMENVSVQNTFDKLDFPTVTGTQAVALAMQGDEEVYRNDVFSGRQDTLATWGATPTSAPRQYVVDSTIDGDTDFIFGDGTLVVDHSMINAINDQVYSEAFLTAPATYAGNPYGILINDSVVSSALKLGQVYLGRAWNPFAGTNPQLLVRNTLLPAQMNSDPYLGISGATWAPGQNEEYDNYGPGAAPASDTSRPQLTAAQAADYTPQKYLAGSDGWDPVIRSAPWPRTGDRRTVTAPVVPQVCQTVSSQLSGATFTAADEENPPDTARIQAALDACTDSNKAVLLAGSGQDTSFLSAPLTVHEGETLLVAPGVTLYATRVAAQYQEAGKATCGSIGSSGTGCNPFIEVRGQNAAVESWYSHGKDGTIDGRGNQTIWGTDTTWYQNAATATNEGLSQVNPRLVEADYSDNFTIANITLEDSAKQHVFYNDGIGFTVWGVRIDTTPDSLNTDGFDADSSDEVTITRSYSQEGDDCVALTTNTSAEANVTVSGNHCYGSHGLSIGSGTTYGLDSILFTGNTVVGPYLYGVQTGYNDGMRIKSAEGKGGLVTNVTYANTCMLGVQYPIDLTPNYEPPSGTSIPWFQSVTVVNARSYDSAPGAVSQLEGFDAAHPLGLTLKNVYLDVPATQAEYANITVEGSNLSPSGTGVTVSRSGGPGGPPMTCAFPPFPG